MATKTPREIWFTTTKKGQRQAWFFSRHAFRAFRVPMAQAELELATGLATETTKPEWVGK
jgi:hypothetical protein